MTVRISYQRVLRNCFKVMIFIKIGKIKSKKNGENPKNLLKEKYYEMLFNHIMYLQFSPTRWQSA